MIMNMNEVVEKTTEKLLMKAAVEIAKAHQHEMADFESKKKSWFAACLKCDAYLTVRKKPKMHDDALISGLAVVAKCGSVQEVNYLRNDETNFNEL